MPKEIHERETRPDEAEAESIAPSRRHRPASELRFPSLAPASGLQAAGRESLSDDLRANAWALVHEFLFAPRPDFDVWTSGVTGRPAVTRVWAAPPLAGDPELLPEDVDVVVEEWFSVIETSDAFAFLETVHQCLEVSNRHRFVAACNQLFERGGSDHRFVLERLVPIASKSDIATIERAVAAARRRPNLAAVEHQLYASLARLAARPRTDSRGAIQESIRAVESAAFLLTNERHWSLDETLEDLERLGHIDAPFKAAYGGLFAFAGGQRRTTTDDARLIFVMCASLVTHLAARLP